jgi:signal transduction histidine kinase
MESRAVGAPTRMKIGTRFTLIMLAFLLPVGVAFILLIAHNTTEIFSQDLKIEARIARRALNESLAPDGQASESGTVRDILSAMGGGEDLLLALLDESARLRFALPRRVPITIPSRDWISARIKSDGAAEFVRKADGRLWFCRIEPLGSGISGYLLLVQDWTALREERFRWIAASLFTDIGFLLTAAIGIPLLIRRYIARPLAELHRRITILGDPNVSEHAPSDDNVGLMSEEFKRIDEQLADGRRRLLQENERRLQMERRMLYADKLATIGTLASGFAHEVGTPLSVIRGRAEMLLDSNFEQTKVNESLELIITQIDHISRMIRVLLDLGRCRTGIRVVSDLRAIVDRAIQLLEPEAVRRGVAVIANLGARPLMVNCDPDQLQQVFVNLELNALDAMSPGGGILRVNSVPHIHGQVRLSFEDSGPGVPAAIRDRIFDPFFTTKSRGQGTGMGLAVSQSVVIDHDGELILERHAPGACFVVTLPASSVLERAPRV